MHDLLAESGLGQFYDLNRHPGVRIRQPAKRQQWAYLDDPGLQQRLLDFTDGKVSRVTFQIPAIHCVACVWLLENLFRLHPGIGRSQVNFPRREAAITFAPEKIALSELVGLLASIGYEPVLTLGELEKRQGDPARKRQWLQVGIAGFAFGNIMLLSLPLYLGLDSLQRAAVPDHLRLPEPGAGGAGGVLQRVGLLAVGAAVAAATDADAGCADRARARGALRAKRLRDRAGTGPGLPGLAGRAWCSSCFAGGCSSRRPTTGWRSTATSNASSPCRPRARRRPARRAFPFPTCRSGDRLLLRNGELIPADARLVSGPACIDYSFVTGEAEPVAKAAGDYLYAGGRQIGGAIEVETVKAVSQSHLTSLWNHEAFQKDRESSLNTLTNRYSRWFTLIVIAVAVGAAVFWLACRGRGRGGSRHSFRC